jgi:hypothetical protein
MNLKHITPKAYEIPLSDCSTDTVFRFPHATGGAYMRLPLDGSDFYAMYEDATGSNEKAIEAIIDDLDIYNEELYAFDESEEDERLVNPEWVEQNLAKFLAFLSLPTGTIWLAHREERVIPLCATLTVEDMRVPN